MYVLGWRKMTWKILMKNFVSNAHQNISRPIHLIGWNTLYGFSGQNNFVCLFIFCDAARWVRSYDELKFFKFLSQNL